MAESNAAGGDGAVQPTTLMSSFFPSPPSSFASFTKDNLDLARKLVEHPSYSLEQVKANTEDPKAWLEMQNRVLQEMEISDEEIERVKDIDLASLVTPPDVDLIEADGHWMAFGQAWPVRKANIRNISGTWLTLASFPRSTRSYRLWKTWVSGSSIKPLQHGKVCEESHLAYSGNDADSALTDTDRRQALQALLHTALHTYLRLLSILTAGPPSLTAEQAAFQSGRHGEVIKTQADTAIEHIKLASINIHHLCNEWRPVQARENLKMLMRVQIEERKRRTKEIQTRVQSHALVFHGTSHSIHKDLNLLTAHCRTCEEISQRLAALKTLKTKSDVKEDNSLASRASSMAIDESARSKVAIEPVQQSIKEKARARMLQRLEKLEKS